MIAMAVVSINRKTESEDDEQERYIRNLIRVQSEQIRETPAEYVARKYGIRGDADGRLQHGRLPEIGSGSSGDGCYRLHKGAKTAPKKPP